MSSNAEAAAREPTPRRSQIIASRRQQLGLSQADLGKPEFSGEYIAALERDACNPSNPALQLLWRRLGLPPDQLQTSPDVNAESIDLQASSEDLRYQTNMALAQIRAGDTNGGLALLDEAAGWAAPWLDALPDEQRILIPYARAYAAYKLADYPAAERILLETLAVVGTASQATLNVRNLLGAVYFEQERAELALKQHLQCLNMLVSRKVKDLNLKLRLHQNLALDYYTLNDQRPAIQHYKAALTILDDLDDEPNRAAVYRGLMLAYQADGDYAQAKSYGLRALRIYERTQQDSDSALISVHLADILLKEDRLPEAEQLLQQAKWHLRATDEPGIWSYLQGDWAELRLRQGQLAAASEHAADGISLAEANIEQARQAAGQREHPIRAYAEALQIAGLVAAGSGHDEAADGYFARAIAQIDATGFGERADAIRLAYADVLRARGHYQQSNEYYREIADLRNRRRDDMYS